MRIRLYVITSQQKYVLPTNFSLNAGFIASHFRIVTAHTYSHFYCTQSDLQCNKHHHSLVLLQGNTAILDFLLRSTIHIEQTPIFRSMPHTLRKLHIYIHPQSCFLETDNRVTLQRKFFTAKTQSQLNFLTTEKKNKH